MCVPKQNSEELFSVAFIPACEMQWKRSKNENAWKANMKFVEII